MLPNREFSRRGNRTVTSLLRLHASLIFVFFFVSHSTGARTFINRLTEYRVMSVDALQCGPLASVTRILDAIFLGFLFLALVALGMGFFLGFLPPLFTYCFPCLAVSCFLF